MEEMLEGMYVAVHSLARVLETKCGSDSLPENLRLLVAAGAQATAESLEQEIDSQIKSGSQPLAAKFVRAAMNVSWDDAHGITERWSGYTRAERIRVIRFTKLGALISSNKPSESSEAPHD
jgi:hypothetical protein